MTLYAARSCPWRGPTSHYYLGVTWERKNDAARAQAAFEKALELKPDYAQAHSSLGLFYWRQNDRPRALEEFRQAVMSDPDLAEATTIWA